MLISERVTMFQLKILHRKFNQIQIYAPTSAGTDEVVERLYQQDNALSLTKLDES